MGGIGQPTNRTIARTMQREGKPLSFIATYLDIDLAEATALLAPKPRKPLRRTTAQRRRQSTTTSTAQREKCREAACVVCRRPADHSAHIIDKGQAADRGDSRAVVPMCKDHHTAYDEGDFDLLPYLEPHHREELAYAVERFGLLSTLQRVTGSRWQPVTEERRAA